MLEGTVVGKRAVVAAAVVLASLVVLSGCGGDVTPLPVTPPTSRLLPHGAPVVAAPLDFTAFYNESCLALTPEQRSELGLTEGHPEARRPGAECTYAVVGEDGDHLVDIWFAKTGLVDEYEANAAGVYRRWGPRDFDGYPGVVLDGELKGTRAVIGLSDTTTVHVWCRDQAARPDAGACGLVARIAPAVLATVRAAQ
ncbi:DUF3558 family protein [Actinokineospora fastidiosa]|uniref:DUF3558 domain-containing protein n=1 Tax=Actinokineospora fastidiosa TaxID=1816 RepID=A0A918LG61_9PSEU|nr:DUF3558 family protein [Actinokineospora fastidiosa]GGS42794.1 hypothetical protein GCM10010171_42280 [Actinokineospora fastidiosa]